jgi:two-component system sensor histidine kinase PilS (NtrC family)
MSTRRKDIFWFILLRLIIVTTILISVVVIHYASSATLSLSAFYLIFLAYFLSAIYFLFYLWGKNYSLQVYIQIFFDLLLITALVYFSGGLKGSFYFLYVFEIIAASIVISRSAAYITAILSGVLFAALIDGMYLGVIPQYPSGAPTPISLDALVTNVLTSWGVFFLVALLMSYLTGSLRKTREQLEHAQKELEVKKSLALAGEISAHLAHEIRNPLAAISGSVQVLRKEIALTGEQQDLMNIVVDESDRVSRSIEQFLNLASPGKQTFMAVDLSQVLKESIMLLQRSGELNGTYRVEGNYESAGILCYGNSNQFKQIFWNLIKNALKAMPEGGTLSIDLKQRKKNEIEIKVRDNGKGMAMEDKERLFEPFYSGFKSGKGIGMAVVRRIVDDYNGKIQVSSELNRGTEIAIILPQGNLNKKDIANFKKEKSNGQDPHHR